jgi:hypothetical protein
MVSVSSMMQCSKTQPEFRLMHRIATSFNRTDYVSSEQWNDAGESHCPVVCILWISYLSTGQLACQLTAKALQTACQVTSKCRLLHEAVLLKLDSNSHVSLSSKSPAQDTAAAAAARTCDMAYCRGADTD